MFKGQLQSIPLAAFSPELALQRLGLSPIGFQFATDFGEKLYTRSPGDYQMGLQRFSSIAILSLMGLALVSTDVLAQRGGPGGGFPQSSIMLLMREDVQGELDLVEDQVEDIKAMQDEMRNKMRDMFNDMREQGGGFDRDSMMEKMGEVNKEFESQVKEILLPHQFERLGQIKIQSDARRSGGATGGALPSSLVEKLNITEEQQEAMKKKAEEVKKSMDEKIAKIRAQAEEEVLSVLSAKQREEYKAMIGDQFKFDDTRGGFGGRGGAQGGGRGGAPGGGGRGGAPGGGRGGAPQSDF